MKKYKGYYIDGCTFCTESDIDEFVKAEAIRKYSNLCAMFSKSPSMELNAIMCAHSARLHDLGLSYEEIENIEIIAFR